MQEGHLIANADPETAFKFYRILRCFVTPHLGLKCGYDPDRVGAWSSRPDFVPGLCAYGNGIEGQKT
ncbi:MAG: hypothetical protein ACO34J_00760 [Prochlorothrix sp.]